MAEAETLGERLYKARKRAKLTQKELGKLAGVRQQTIASLESDEQRSTSFIVELANALQVRPEWLSAGRGPMELSAAEARATYSDLPIRARNPGEIEWLGIYRVMTVKERRCATELFGALVNKEKAASG